MKLSDFNLLNPQVLTLTVEGQNAVRLAWKNNKEVQFWKDENNILWLRQGDILAEVQPLPANIDPLFSRKELPWLLVRSIAEKVHIQFAEPADWLPLEAPLDLCVDEKVAAQLKRAGAIDKEEVAVAIQWCENEFLIEGNPQRLAAVRFNSGVPGDWQIVGTSWRADLQRNANGKVIINRVARSALKVESWSLIQGIIKFVDISVSTQLLSESQQAMLKQAVQSNGDYIELWNKYSQQEWQKSLLQAAQLGVIEFEKCVEANQEGGAWRFIIEKSKLQAFRANWEHLEGDGSLVLEAGSRLPNWLSDRYQNLTVGDNTRRFSGKPSFERNAIVIENARSEPPSDGFLYLSLAGDRTVQERRQKALHSINTTSRSLKLRYILQGVNVPTPRPVRHEALTPAARACFKSGEATDSQEDAIRMALDTPDIALIIGPPGTGKTQVIAALSQRLAEIGGESGLQHQVLITSFQHDAVENTLDRTRIFGLPPIKLGVNRHGNGINPVQVWCEQTYQQLGGVLEEQNAHEPHIALFRELNQTLSILRHAQLDNFEQLTLLNQVSVALHTLENKHRIRLPRQLQDTWRDYIEQIPNQGISQPEKSIFRAIALTKVRALRVTPMGFEDDGSERAVDAQLAISTSGIHLHPDDFQLLTELEYLQQLDESMAYAASNLRDRLVDALMPDYRPAEIRHRLNLEGRKLIGAIEDSLVEKLKSSSLGVSSVLTRYRDTFVNNPVRTRETVHEYGMVVGATCQQSASTAMADLKSLSGIGDSGIVFDNVIIDEAARANPLDLFIPMSMAGRRVILVGDHRQLPHLLEPELENELAETHDLGKEQRNAFQESLFEKLWRQLRDNEVKDGFPRVVMLDTQFRMHPILGKFVSQQFYEKEGLSPIKPGRDSSEFLSNIPGYEGKICGWLNVPLRHGKEDKRGHSRIRIAEAQSIAKEVKRLLDSCAPEVSIGIITFYAAQRDAILECLSGFQLTERSPDGEAWQVSASWCTTPSNKEKLRIGTVDAFQGKEFDIVLLSIVRANEHSLPIGVFEGDDYEKQANRKYGHLRLSNRMNVAMSRQRSLLIVVGDREMAACTDAKRAIPALSDFLTLCEGEHGAIL